MGSDHRDRFVVADYETTGLAEDDVPIEVGLVLCDSKWRKLESYDALIDSEFARSLPADRWEGAFAVHGISQKEVRSYGSTPRAVAEGVVWLAKEWRPADGRLILLSDNIQFEWINTAWLLHHVHLRVSDCFHYCGWDTSILSLYTSFRDPENPPHRALPDALGLVHALRRVALDSAG